MLVIMNAETKEVVERWAFDIQTDRHVVERGGRVVEERDVGIVMQEVQAIIRQITASVTFLPLLQDTCTIDVLAYTDKDSDVPLEWCVCVCHSLVGWSTLHPVHAQPTLNCEK